MRRLSDPLPSIALSLITCSGLFARNSVAQNPPPPRVEQAPVPATKLESFQPAAGTIVTVGYDELGNVGGILGVSVDVREIRGAGGTAVRGLVVEVTESQYKEARSFVDADEIGELLKGLDALLAVQANPTSFKSFEVRYTTRGGFQLTAFNGRNDKLSYAVQVGTVTTAQHFLSAEDLQKLRAMFVAGQEKIASLSAAK